MTPFTEMSDYKLIVYISLLAKDVSKFGAASFCVKRLEEATAVLEERFKNKSE